MLVVFRKPKNRGRYGQTVTNFGKNAKLVMTNISLEIRCFSRRWPASAGQLADAALLLQLPDAADRLSYKFGLGQNPDFRAEFAELYGQTETVTAKENLDHADCWEGNSARRADRPSKRVGIRVNLLFITF